MNRFKIKLLWLLFLIVSCTDEIDVPLPSPVSYKHVAHYQGFPVLEFSFTQRLGEKKGENLTNLKIKNIRNTAIDSLKYVVSVFKSKERTAENYEYFFADSIGNKLAAGDTTKPVTINNSSGLILKEGLVEVGIISMGRDNKFSNIYQGTFKAYSDTTYTSSGLVASNITNGYITADGFLNIKLAGGTTTKIIRGFMDEADLFHGEALRADGSLIAKLTSAEKAAIADGALKLVLRFEGNNNQDGIRTILLSLSEM